MKITLVQIGKTEEKCFREATEIYENRLKHYTSFEIKCLANIKNAKTLTESQLKENEVDDIVGFIQQNDRVVLLDERGKIFTSVEFAGYMDKKGIQGTKSLIFVAGGAYGFSQAVYKRADDKLSLSAMTFTHQMVRLVFTEQLYRAFTIIKGEPYHHE